VSLRNLLRRSRDLRLATVIVAAALAAALVVTAAFSGIGHIRVRPGDTLTAIAARYHTSVAELIALNHLPGNGNLIYAGQTLAVPISAPAGSPATRWTGYRVVPGDTVDAIAARFHTTVAALARRNHLSGALMIYVGQRLAVPAPAAPALRWMAYRVGPGDTLDGIAARFHTSAALIAARNHLPASLIIDLGATLYLPAGGSFATPERGAPSGGPGPSVIRSMIVATARDYGVDPALALAVAWQESGWNQDVISVTQAVGAMQVEPETGVFVGRYLLHRSLNLSVAADNVDAGVAMLGLLLREAPPAVAVAGYYQGLASVRSRGMFPDTRRYVADVLALRRRFGG
jgi:LysM repeat protein